MNKALLIIFDGFGEGNPSDPGNAQELADMKFYKSLKQKYPNTTLKAIGNAVGLPEGFMGNSEVGHFTIGAGRVIFQSFEKINKSIQDGDFFTKEALLNAVKIVKNNKSCPNGSFRRAKIHLLGMISDEGVHAHIDHLFALFEFCKRNGITENVYIHAITDGRDVPERSAKKYIEQILQKINEYGFGEIATICGRFYAMDRDHNMDRTMTYFDLLTQGKGFESQNALEAIEESYKRGDKTDYYIQPIVLDRNGLIEKQDAVIFFNFRTDRAKQITENFTKGSNPYLKPEQFVCFGPYSDRCPVLYPVDAIKNNLGEYLSNLGKKQLRAAETEKYAHVTFFFNSQVEDPYPGEERLLVNSPKCASYAEKPEMSAQELTDKVIEKLIPQPPLSRGQNRDNPIDKWDLRESSLDKGDLRESSLDKGDLRESSLDKGDLRESPLDKGGQGGFDFIALNYANGDLVGHSGDLKATIKCCQVLDECLEKLIPVALESGYEILFTCDHGNCEEMLYPNGDPKPAHSLNPVPCILISNKYKNVKLKENRGLKDIAPTILDLMDLPKPDEMSGESLISKYL